MGFERNFAGCHSGAARLMGAVSLAVLAASIAAPARAQTAPAGQQGQAAEPNDAASGPDTSSTSSQQADVVAGGDAAGGAEQTTAADGDPADGGEIVVTGFRASISSAIGAKRRSSTIIDVIKAEDIADFPDNNLAESIQRIPGVSIARDAGEGRQITVRGLGPQFTRVRINGIEGQSTTGGTDSSGGANRSRSFDFNVFASELFNSITVRKTASAETEEGSLGASVDLQTSRPFDYKGTTAVVSAEGSYNDLSKKLDPRLAGLFSTTFHDGMFGVLVSAAYTKRRTLEEGHGSGGWLDGTNNTGYNPASPFAAANLPTTYSPRFPRYGRLTHRQERLGLTGSLQFRPEEETLLTFDALYSRFKATRQENWLENLSFARPLSQGGRPEVIVRAGEINDKGDLVYGLFDDVDIQTETRFDKLTTTYQQYTLSGEHRFGARFKLDGLIGYSKSDFDNPIQTTVILNRNNTDGYSYDYRVNRNLPLISYGFDVTDPNSFAFGIPRSEIRLRPNSVINTIKTAQLNATFEANENLTFRAGANIKRYKFTSDALARVNEGLVPQLPAGTTLASLTTPLTGFGRHLDLPAGTPTSWITPNIDAFAQLFDIYSNSGLFALSGATNANARGNIRGVTEEDRALYGQLNFNFDIGIPIRGDIGMRYVQTRQSSRGYQLAGTTPVEVTVKRRYEDWLPALNLTAEVTPDFLLRFGAAKVMTRPNLGSLTPGGSISSVGVFSVSSGNPALDPIRANTLDFSAEWYFAPHALISLGLFYKDIKTFIQTRRITQPFNQSGLPLELLTGLSGNPQPTDQFTFSQPVNTKGGPLKGFEINYQQPFSFLPGPFSNFGALLNYTYVDSKIDYVFRTGFVRNDLIGLSKNAYNATLYYEDSRFSARVSGAYRSKYLTAVPSGTSTNDVDGTRSTFTVDASVSYNVGDHLKLTIEGLNLTDEFNQQFTDSRRDSIVVYSHTGRQINFGVRYSF